ncbi:MAG: hypothetical protein KAQ85_11825 [Thermodesulfovibrionia bacterium]|nr:hypothetical protein [Thermodesulfovibrionia bacterium]
MILIVIPISYSLEYNIGLEEGWNLISIPFQISNNSITYVLSSISGNYNNVVYYNSTDNEYHIYDPDDIAHSNLFSIDHKLGFWIDMKTQDILTINGDYPSSTTISLKQGWNLIGYPSPENRTLSEINGLIDDKAEFILAYDNLSFESFIENKSSNRLGVMQQGFGYFVKMLENRDLVISSNGPAIESITISPDEDAGAGIQVYPKVNDIKTVTVSVLVTDLDGTSDIKNVSMQTPKGKIELVKVGNIDSDTANYNASFDMDYYDTPQIYDIDVTAYDNDDIKGVDSKSFEYLELAALILDASALTFENANPTQSSYIWGDLDISTTGNGTIKNVGNIVVDVMVSATDLTGPETITADNTAYQFSTDGFSALSNTPTAYDLSLNPASLTDIDFRLNVPAGILPGNYNSDFTITATSDT